MKLDKDTLRGFGGVLLSLLIIGAIHIIKPNITRAPDFPCTTSGSSIKTIDVHSGETGSEIAADLHSQGVTASYEAFFRVAVGDPRSASIAPGVHEIDGQICAKVALEQLLDSRRIRNLLVINEGAWNSEIKSALMAIGKSKLEVDSAFAEIAIPRPFNNLEGLLFPAQYSFESSTPVSKILTSMIARGEKEMATAGILPLGSDFSSQQLLVIASLVQAEGDSKDFRKISRVVRNRLSAGMPLQFDSTVHYIKKSRGSVFLSTQSTLISSAYNTYRRYGLPPGPINNPGSAAMYAATHPEKGAWLYFITVSPGDTRFTDSLVEFNNWKLLYKENLKAGKFGTK